MMMRSGAHSSPEFTWAAVTCLTQVEIFKSLCVVSENINIYSVNEVKTQTNSKWINKLFPEDNKLQNTERS